MTAENKIILYQDDLQRSVLHYNLDMVIALGYRVQSQVATFDREIKRLKNNTDNGNQL
ncbi:MAG: hypothetical protein ACI3ZY_06660 [Parabacteroides sp.]